MALKKKWHLILGKTEGTNLVNASFSNYSGIALLTIMFVFLLMVTASVMFLVRWHVHFPQIEQVRAENKILRSEVDRLMTEIDSITFRLEQMQEWEEQLRLERNLDSINRDVREMGSGGLPQIEVDFPELGKETNLNLNMLWNSVRELDARSKFAYEARESLLENVSLQEEMYRYTPSIYPAFGRISSPYGWRTHPVTGRRDFHRGLDISNGPNSPIYVTADGTIREVGYNRFYGRYIVVDHRFGYQTMYAHMNKAHVERGQKVTRGDIIGAMGSTGRSTGSHLHYEVRKYRKTVNPYHYLNKMENQIVVAGN